MIENSLFRGANIGSLALCVKKKHPKIIYSIAAAANRVGGDFDWNKSGKIVHVSKFKFKATEMGIRAFVMKPKDW